MLQSYFNSHFIVEKKKIYFINEIIFFLFITLLYSKKMEYNWNILTSYSILKIEKKIGVLL